MHVILLEVIFGVVGITAAAGPAVVVLVREHKEQRASRRQFEQELAELDV